MTNAFQPVLSIRDRVEERQAPSFIREALREIRGYIEEHHVEVQGPPFWHRSPVAFGRLDVEVGWPVRGASGSGRIVLREMPCGLVRNDRSGEQRLSHAWSRDAVA